MNAGRGLLHFGIDVAVGDKNVQPAVVVVVEKSSAETQHVMRGPGKASDWSLTSSKKPLPSFCQM